MFFEVDQRGVSTTLAALTAFKDQKEACML